VSVTAAAGFVAAGAPIGIKASGAHDLAVVATADRAPVATAAVFTTNLAAAPPVQLSRARLAASGGRASAVVLSSGNANAATGTAGYADATRMTELAADALGCDAGHVLVCSTGLIGIPMPMDVIEAGIPGVASAVAPGSDAGLAAARAIMTTDTKPKLANRHADLGGGRVAVVGGMAKGAGMIAPAMATMLATLTTDAAVEPLALQRALHAAVDASFNSLTVDGCTSTNDTVIVMASGAAGGETIGTTGFAFHALVDALTDACRDLALQMADDAEGVTKTVEVRVRGARSGTEARTAARAVAGSLLVKCSLYGADPYWGRILSELGASGAVIDPDRTSIAYNGHVVCRFGIAAAHDADAVAASMRERRIGIDCDLGLGTAEATVLTTDLGHGYIDENMGTS
jgi:glutamate N-acetyltransferase / amino-acid N-acetyltransferase